MELQAEQQDDEAPAWLREAEKLWYNPQSAVPIIEQALAYACYGQAERIDYWRRPALVAGCASADGYLPGVSWNPPGWKGSVDYSAKYLERHTPAESPPGGYRLSVSRLVATLREAYRPSPLNAEVHMKERQAIKLSDGGWELRGVEQRAWLQSLAEALGGRLKQVR